MRREISPSAIQVGQIAQIKMQFRLLKQDSGSFTFREMLKGIYVLHDGLSMVRPIMRGSSFVSAEFCRRILLATLPLKLGDPRGRRAVTSNFIPSAGLRLEEPLRWKGQTQETSVSQKMNVQHHVLFL